MTRVKICGLREAEHARAAVAAGADFLGFIFYPRARRYVEPAVVREILEGTPRGATKAVGVFVNEGPRRIEEIVALCGLDAVQLSGDESVDACRRIGVPVLKTIHVGAALDRGRLAELAPAAWAIHLDTARPRQFGGTGETFDWAAARGLGIDNPVFVAGGLTPANVAEAIATARPWAVDVSSGVEIGGRKDAELIRRFVEGARGSLPPTTSPTAGGRGSLDGRPGERDGNAGVW